MVLCVRVSAPTEWFGGASLVDRVLQIVCMSARGGDMAWPMAPRGDPEYFSAQKAVSYRGYQS